MSNKIYCIKEADNFNKASHEFEEVISEQRKFFDNIWDWENASPQPDILENGVLKEKYKQRAKELEKLVEDKSKKRLEAFLIWSECETSKAKSHL